MISNRCARKSLVTNCNSIISKNYLRFLVDSNVISLQNSCYKITQTSITNILNISNICKAIAVIRLSLLGFYYFCIIIHIIILLKSLYDIYLDCNIIYHHSYPSV